MLRDAALLRLCLFAACAADPPSACEAPPQRMADDSPTTRSVSPLPRASDALFDALARCPTADEMRAQLEAGLTRQELHIRGFDDATIAECIDNLIAAALDSRKQPDRPRVRARLDESADLFVAVQREAMVRRYAGAASCLPPVR